MEEEERPCFMDRVSGLGPTLHGGPELRRPWRRTAPARVGLERAAPGPLQATLPFLPGAGSHSLHHRCGDRLASWVFPALAACEGIRFLKRHSLRRRWEQAAGWARGSGGHVSQRRGALLGARGAGRSRTRVLLRNQAISTPRPRPPLAPTLRRNRNNSAFHLHCALQVTPLSQPRSSSLRLHDTQRLSGLPASPEGVV